MKQTEEFKINQQIRIKSINKTATIIQVDKDGVVVQLDRPFYEGGLGRLFVKLDQIEAI